MSTPNDPDAGQPGQPGQAQPDPYGYQAYPGQPGPYGYPAYPQPPYSDQHQGQFPAQYPAQYPAGYPPYGAGLGYPGYPQVPAAPPRRPGALIAAGVIWLLLGGIMLLFGIALLFANRLEGIGEVYADYPEVTPEIVTGLGVVMTVLAVIVVGLGVVVFTGALWARIAIAVVGGLLGLFGITAVVFPVLALAAIVLQFLPASNAYGKARRERPA